MKLKRLIPLVALALCTVVMLVSCGGVDFEKDVANMSFEKDTLAVQPLPELDGYNIIEGDFDIVIAYKLDAGDATYRVYNMKTMTETRVCTYTAEDLSKLALKGVVTPVTTMNGITYIVSISGEELVYTYLTPSGRVIKENTEELGTVKNDCFVLGNTIYRLEPITNEVMTSYERGDLAGEIPDCDFWTEKYYYIEDGDTITTYDEEYNFLATYTMPSYASEGGFHLFNDGYVVIQYKVRVDTLSEEYDILENAIKWDLVTLRFNPKSGKTTEIKTDYVLELVVPVLEAYREEYVDGLYGKKLDNVVAAYEIKDRMVDESGAALLSLDLNSKLSGSRINEYEGVNISLEQYGGGHVVYTSADDLHTWVFNAKGKLIGEVNGVVDFTEKYIVTVNGIYDYELKKLSDFKVSGDENDLVYMGGESSLGTIGSKLLFKSVNAVGTYYLFDGLLDENGDMFHMLGDESVMDIRPDVSFYGKRDTTTGDYVYYDAAGNVLFTSYGRAASYTYEASGENYILVGVYNAEGVKQLYRVEQ